MNLLRWLLLCRHRERFWERRGDTLFLVCADCGDAVRALPHEPWRALPTRREGQS